MTRRAVVVAMVMAMAACAAPDGEATPGTPSPAGPDQAAQDADVASATPVEAAVLTAEVRQSRSDWGVRRVQVRVVNGGSTPVDVATATLDSSIVDRPVTSDPARGRPVPPGRYRDFPVDLGSAVCPAQDAPSSAVVVRTVDGQEVSLVPADPQSHLSRINREDCAEQRLRETVRLELGPTVTAQERDGRLVGMITLTATVADPDVEVAVTRIEGTVLLSPVGGPSWAPPELARVGDAPTTAVLEFLPGRCDPHAVAEDKRGTFLPVHVRIDGEQLPVVYVPAPDALRGQVYDHLATACGW